MPTSNDDNKFTNVCKRLQTNKETRTTAHVSNLIKIKRERGSFPGTVPVPDICGTDRGLPLVAVPFRHFLIYIHDGGWVACLFLTMPIHLIINREGTGHEIN